MTVARALLPTLVLAVAGLPAAARAAPPLTADDFAPVFDDARVTRALDRLAGGDAAGAREILLAIGQDGKPVAHLERVRFLLGLACVRSQDWLGAVTVLDKLDEAVPAVADRVLLLRGQALAGLGRNDEAVETLARVPRSSAVGVAALRARGDALVAAGRHADAAAVFLDVVAAGRKDPETVGRLAAALLAAGRRDEAIPLLRKAYFESPGPGRAAYRRVLSDLGASPEPGTPAEALVHARALLDAQANEEAAAEGSRLAGSKDADAACGALIVRGSALAKLRRHADAVAAYDDALARCGARIDVPKALYNAARSAWRSGDRRKGDALAERLAREHPASTLNDDLAVTRARSAMSRGDGAGANGILAKSLKSWPSGDMADESRWVLAWTAWRSGDAEAAAAAMREGLAEAGADAAYGSRFSYWLGRALDRAGRTEEARAAWERCASSYPMTFYGQLSVRRVAAVRGCGPAEAIRRLPSPPARPAPFLTCGAEAMGTPAIARARWLMETGLPGMAAEEAAEVADAGGEEAWVAALVLDAGGMHTRSHRLASSLLAASRFWPDAATAGYWRIAYPRPWQDVVARAAKESGVDPALIWAVMREESAFVAGIESRANAIGLMQLILPTARTVAKRLGLTATPETLRRPEVNIRLGAGFLAELMGDFGEPILAIPGYNAGGGAISRWLRENPGVPTDEFVESIGAQETRDYARKVFESYAAYRYLYGEGDARFAPLRFAVAGKAAAKPAAAKPAPAKPAPKQAKKAPAKPPKKPAAKKKSPPRGKRR